MIIPTLPQLALTEIKFHQATKRMAVQRILEPKILARCKNCMDEGAVFVSFLGTGPTQQPVTMHKPSTYVETGWYVIERTAAYPCPVCS